MSDVKARILLWGIEGSGKTTSLEMIHSKLQPSLRGDIHQEPTAIDPTVYSEVLRIRLGQVGGVENQIEIIAVPGAAGQETTRKQLLDRVDGIVLVIDCSTEQIHQNMHAIVELRKSLGDYGRELNDVPVVVQYNKRDIADPFEIEEFHRRSGLTHCAVFETIATTGHGILSTLTTISKNVIRARKGQPPSASPAPSPAAEESRTEVAIETTDSLPIDAPLQSSAEILEAAILAEGDLLDDATFGDSVELELTSPGLQPDWNATSDDAPKSESSLGTELRIVSAGVASVDSEGGLRLPLVLGDESGKTRSVVLSLRLDALLDVQPDQDTD